MLVTDEQVRNHLRIGAGEDVSVYVGAAERLAAEFMNRKVYASDTDLQAAIAAYPGTLAAAIQANADAREAIAVLPKGDLRDAAEGAMQEALSAAIAEARSVYLGMVINDMVSAAILLLTGSLYANRENEVVGASVAELSIDAARLLWPDRKCLGV